MKKGFVFVVLVGASLLLAACSGGTPVVVDGGAGVGSYSTGLTVTGHGQVNLAPDVAFVTIGVHTESTDVASAVQYNANQVAAVMAALSQAGIAAEDMQTSNFSVYTMDNYDPNTGLTNGKKYSVDNTVNVKARALSSLGNLLDSAISAGANSIWGVSFDLEDKDAPQAQARDMAVADAQAQAQALATASGVSLGNIISVSYVSSPNYYPYYGLGMGGGGGGEGVPSTSIVPGQITVTADVNITYAIK